MNKKIIASMLLLFFALFSTNAFASSNAAPTEEVKHEYHEKSMGQLLESFYKTTGIYAFTTPRDDVMTSEAHAEDARPMTTFEQTWGRLIMIGICLFLFYLAISKGFEPLLLMPIAFGGILANIPLAGIGGETGMLGIIYNMGIANGFFPLLIFMGVGAMTDFTPLLANPKAAILGGAAQFGIFGSLVGAVAIKCRRQYMEHSYNTIGRIFLCTHRCT